MKGKIRKWGHSLALRIPRSFAEEAQVADGSDVDLQIKDGHLVVVPTHSPPTLRSLLARVTSRNIHGETDTGDSEGGEVW